MQSPVPENRAGPRDLDVSSVGGVVSLQVPAELFIFINM